MMRRKLLLSCPDQRKVEIILRRKRNEMATDIFIKIEGPDIKGECKIAGYEEWIEAGSFSESVFIPRDSSGSGQAAGRATLSEFSVSSEVGAHSNFLKEAVLGNVTYGKVTVHFVKQQPGDGGVKPYDTRVIENCFVNSYSTSKGSDSKGQEGWSFGGTKVEWEYFLQADNGLIGASKGKKFWDIAAAKTA